MAQLTHLVKQDFTARSRTANVDTEETNYTISWANLTGAGFADGHQVGIIVFCKHRSSNNAGYSRFQVKKGSTFSGAGVLPGSLQDIESAGTTANTGHNYVYAGEITLATNDNIYFSSYSNSTYTNTTDEFVAILFKIYDLGAANYRFASTSPSGDAPTSETSGADITLPAAGDWLIVTTTQWLDDSTTGNAFIKLVRGSTPIMLNAIQGEDTANTMNLGGVAGVIGASADETITIRYWAGTASTHDCVHTAVMGIRLDAFAEHQIDQVTSQITQTAVDTYLEIAGIPAYTPSVTAPHLIIASALVYSPLATNQAYGRIQIDGADWPAAGVGRTSEMVNGPATTYRNLMFAGYGSLTASAAYDIDVDYAEDNTVATQPYAYGSQAIVFSMELAGGGSITLSAGAGSVAISGTAAGLKASRRVAAGSGSVALAGTAATLSRGRRLPAAAGAMSLGGQAAALLALRRMPAATGAAAISGAAAGLTRGRRLGAGSGAVAIAGAATGLLAGRKLAAAAGALEAGGAAAALRLGRRLPAGAGAYAIGGAAAALSRSIRLPAASGAVAISGAAAELVHTQALSIIASGGTVALAGQGAALRLDRRMPAAAGAVAVSGAALGFLLDYRLPAAAGAVGFTGLPAVLRWGPAFVPEGRVSVTITARAPGVTCAARGPSAAFSAKQPAVVFTAH